MEVLQPTTHLGIKAWPESDKPREKLRYQGKKTLSDAELLAILIRAGNQEESAVALAKRLLKSVNFDLQKLGRLSVEELLRFKGVGEAKAIAILAALELGARRESLVTPDKEKIKSSYQIYRLFRPLIGDLNHEELWILLLNRANNVINKVLISKGGLDGTTADPKVIFKHALDQQASSVIVCHNHPSGNLQASKADQRITKKIQEAGQLLDLPLLDHLIISYSGYFSFADEGLL